MAAPNDQWHAPASGAPTNHGGGQGGREEGEGIGTTPLQRSDAETFIRLKKKGENASSLRQETRNLTFTIRFDAVITKWAILLLHSE